MASSTSRRALCHIALIIVIVVAGLPPAGASAAQIRLSADLPPGATVVSYQISPDGAHVVYGLGQAGHPEVGVLRLLSVPLAGGAAQTLVSVFPPVSISSYQITPDGGRVVYIVPDGAGAGSALYAVPIGGPDTARIMLSDPKGLPWVNGFVVSPDGGWVVYDADDQSFVSALYSVSISAAVGTPITLHSASISNQVSEYRVTPDSQTVVFTDFTMGWKSLYSVPIAGPAATSVGLGDAAEGSVFRFAITPDSARVVYIAGWMGPARLYRVSTSGRDATAGMIGGAVSPVEDLALSPDGSRVVFTGREGTGAPLDIYSVLLDDPTFVGRASASPFASRTVAQFAVTPNGTRVIYRADHDLAGSFDLYAAPLTVAGVPVRLNELLVEGGNVLAFHIASDGAIAYLADQNTAGVAELFSVSPAGAPSPVRISDTLVSGGSVRDFRVDAARGRVIYLADQETAGVLELFASTLQGPVVGGDPWLIKLSGALTPDGSVMDFQLTPDGNHVVYRADQEVSGTAELYLADYGPFGVTFKDTAVSVPEGAGEGSIVVILGEPSLARVCVDYDVTGGSAGRGDFGLVANTSCFAPGEVTKTVTFTIEDDHLCEDDEWFEVSLLSATGGYLRYPTSVRVLIVDNDEPEPPPVTYFDHHLPLVLR